MSEIVCTIVALLFLAGVWPYKAERSSWAALIDALDEHKRVTAERKARR